MNCWSSRYPQARENTASPTKSERGLPLSAVTVTLLYTYTSAVRDASL